jgi:hypothetical protein
MNRRLLITISTALLLIAGTYAAIQFAKGYRPDLKSKEIKGTGLLVTNSLPTGAQVFIDDKLTTATDDTLNLPPAEYTIEIKKDGYIPWQKIMQIEAELVTQANARLFPAVTSLRPLTFTGAANLAPSPDGQKMAFVVMNSSEEAKKGLWVLDLAQRPLSLSKDPRQVARNSETLDFSQAVLGWSPDSSQILAHFPAQLSTSNATETNILLEANDFNSVDRLRDVTARLPVIFSQWEEQIALKINDQLLNLPLEMQNIATASATNLYFSPDEEKLLYLATEAIHVPDEIIPQLPATNTQPEERDLKPGNYYIYDIEEDKNFQILENSNQLKLEEQRMLLIDKITPRTLFSPESSPSAHTKLQDDGHELTISHFRTQYTPISIQPLQWFPDSKHLILTAEDKITVLEYDGTNHSVVYAGNFENQFTFPWPDGSKLLIVTNLNVESTIPPNLYAVNLE